MIPILYAPSPSPGLELSKEPRVLGAAFGDGFGERIPDGINSRLIKTEVEWKLLTLAEADRIDAFLEERNGVKHFYWHVPGENRIRKWLAPKWSKTLETTTATIRATFEEQPK